MKKSCQSDQIKKIVKQDYYILFYSKQKQMKVNLNAKIDNVQIDKVSNKKFFGLITNENVS